MGEGSWFLVDEHFVLLLSGPYTEQPLVANSACGLCYSVWDRPVHTAELGPLTGAQGVFCERRTRGHVLVLGGLQSLSSPPNLRCCLEQL